MSQTISIKLKLDPRFDEFFKKDWKTADSVHVLQLAENELAADNFKYILKSRQNKWIPLTSDYQKWKQKNYPGKGIWELTGATKHALTTRATLGPGGGTVGAKHVSITPLQNGVITATYTIMKPAAGGYFDRLNRMRELWWLTDLSRDRIVGMLGRYISEAMNKAGINVTWNG